MPKYDGRPASDEPLAYFLTWTTYGTWLPGDERGWVAKVGQLREPSAVRAADAQRRLTDTPLELDAAQRMIVEATIRRHCEIRGWHLHAVTCRTNHVHVVVTGRVDPEIIMDQFKAWCTRKLKQHEATRASGSERLRENWWTQRGSKRYINDDVGLEGAVRYVLEGQ